MLFKAPVWLLICVLAALAAGCGGGEKLTPVEGKVLADGQVVPNGDLLFKPDRGKGNNTKHEPAGNIDAQGRYEMFTAGKKGAPLGWYKVIVIATEALDPDKPYAPRKSYINAKYNAEQTSDVMLEVVEKPGPDAYLLKLKK